MTCQISGLSPLYLPLLKGTTPMPESASLVAEMRRFNRFYTRTDRAARRDADQQRVHADRGARAVRARPSQQSRGFQNRRRAWLPRRCLHLNVGPAASEIARELRVDPAYLTRILRKFAAAGLTEVRTDPADRRRRILSLTPAGAAALAGLQAAADSDIGAAGPATCPTKIARTRRRHADDDASCSAGLRTTAGSHAAPARHRRHRLGDRAPVAPLCRRVWLERRI